MSRVSVLVIFNVYLLVQGVASDINIQWNIRPLENYVSQFEIHKTANAAYKEPLKIILEQYNASKLICCKKADGKHIFETTFESSKNQTIIKVAKVTADMSTTWLCKTKNGMDKEQKITFQVRVTGLLNVTIGGSRLISSPSSDLSALSYDDISIYNYTDGEIMDLVCQSGESDGDLRLVYYSENGIKLIKTDPMSSNHSMAFRKKMGINDNFAAVDCTYMPRLQRKYTYRILFRLRDIVTYPFNITVSGLNLVPTAVDQEHQEYKYQYRYFKDETVTVSCGLTQNWTSVSSLSFEDTAMDSKMSTVTKQPNKRTIKMKMATLLNKRLECHTESALSAFIYFRVEPIEPRIQGLSASHVSLRYRKNSTIWVVDYKPPAVKTLILKCVSGTWIKTNDTGSDSITVRPRRNVTSMTCAAKKNNVIRKTIINVSFNRQKLASPPKSSSDTSGYAAGISIGVIMAVISCVILCRCLNKRRV